MNAISVLQMKDKRCVEKVAEECKKICGGQNTSFQVLPRGLILSLAEMDFGQILQFCYQQYLLYFSQHIYSGYYIEHAMDLQIQYSICNMPPYHESDSLTRLIFFEAAKIKLVLSV